MNAPATLSEVTPKTVEFTLDTKTIQAYEGETILKAAKRHGIDIPHLCYKEGYRADGNCRACVVEIAGERTLAPSCCRSATESMQVQAQSARAVKSQKMVLEMLLSDMPEEGTKWVGDDPTRQHGYYLLSDDSVEVVMKENQDLRRKAAKAAKKSTTSPAATPAS